MLNPRILAVNLTLLFVLVACSNLKPEATPPMGDGGAPTGEATSVPEIHIVEREKLIVGVDTAFPPFADLDGEGGLVGLDIDLIAALAGVAGFEYRLVSADWEGIFTDLVAGRYDVVLGGITPDIVPDEWVSLSDPYFEVGQVVAVSAARQEINQLSDLSNAVVGVQPLSWGEFAISGSGAALPLPPGNIRHYDTVEQLVDGLFANHVDAIVTHHTVIDSYSEVNPGDLTILGGGGRVAWLATHSLRIAVPKGADELLSKLNEAIQQLRAEGEIDQLVHKWGFSPTFPERPRFIQDAGSQSLIAGIEKVDDTTVRFILNRPDPFFDYKLAVPSLVVHSPTNLELHYAGGGLADNPVGTGPYKLAGWGPGGAITLTAYSDYWGDLALMDTIVVSPVVEATERYAMLLDGRAQLVENLGAADLSALEEQPDERIALYPRVPVNVAYVGMNRDIPPFDDRQVREAVAVCIDRTQLVQSVYPTGTLVASQFVPPTAFGFSPGLLWYEQDSERAIVLLEQAGFVDGSPLTLSLADRASDPIPDPREIADVIQAQLSGCGITTTVELLDSDDFTERLTTGQLGLYLSGWSADFPGPISFLNTHFTRDAGNLQFGAPYPEIADILEEAASVSDRFLREELYNQANQLLKEKMVFVPLAHGGSGWAAVAGLAGVTTNPVRRESWARLGPLTTTSPITRFVIALSAEPLSLDPSDELDAATFAVTNQILETLVAFEPETTVLVGGLATEWSSNETFDVWEFTLRQGVTFHDGTAFNADSVLENFERLWDSGHPFHVGRSGRFRYFQILFGGFREPGY